MVHQAGFITRKHPNVYAVGSFKVLQFESSVCDRLISSMTVTVCKLAHSVRLIKLVYPLSSLINTVTSIAAWLTSTAMVDYCDSCTIMHAVANLAECSSSISAFSVCISNFISAFIFLCFHEY
jgi:hypothetical protein